MLEAAHLQTEKKISASNNVKRALEANFEMLDDQLAGVEADAVESGVGAISQLRAHFERMKRTNMEKFDKAVEEVNAAVLELERIEWKMKLNQRELAAIEDEANQLTFRGRPSGLYPWPMFYPQPSIHDELTTIVVSICSLCGFGFPHRDIIVAGCMHVYHPWCAYSVFGKGERCVAKTCSATVHPSWFQSFGWSTPSEELVQEGAKLDTDVQMLQFMHEREEAIKDQHPGQEMVSREKRDATGMKTRFCLCAGFAYEPFLSHVYECVICFSLQLVDEGFIV